MTNHPFNPEMLTLARMSRGLTQTELASKVETTQGRVSKIEHGFFVPSDDLVNRLSVALAYPQAFFFQAGYINTLPSWFHRKRKQLAQTTLDRIHAEIAIRIRNIAKLLMSVEVRSVHPVPHFDIDAFDGCVEHVARAVRQHWALPRGPIEDLIDVLERAGVLVVPCDFGATEIDAVGMRLHGMPPLVFINNSAPVDRVRFTIAHELGHLVMHASGADGDVEKEADRFAAEFLMPEYDIKPQLTNVTLALLSVLKRVWRVSMAALLMRAKTLRTITEKRATALWKQMSALGFKKREPAELDLSPERPRLLREMIDFHIKQLGMSAEQVLSMFTLSQPDFDRLYAPERRTGPLRLVVA
jgi:Zn-dependent peptidase ImmA (M78 family)/transcriptional regulator with XRE-family HTH domain